MNNKIYYALMTGGKLPRKIKKTILGKRLTHSKLKRMIKNVIIVKSANTMYQQPTILPYAFCPNCGCTGMSGTGNRTEYPEHWEDFHCYRCNEIVATIDNSPFIHVLEEYKN